MYVASYGIGLPKIAIVGTCAILLANNIQCNQLLSRLYRLHAANLWRLTC